jgi:hypothetical protein
MSPTATMGPVASVAVPTGNVRNQPNLVDDSNRRSQNDVLMGHFAKVTGGEHAGRVCVTEQVVSYGSDGFPDKVQVVTRDDANERLVVDYADLAPTKPHRL